MRSHFKDEEDLIFPNAVGSVQSGRNLVQRYFTPTLKKAGLPKVRFHDLRHTAATLWLEQGLPVTVVAKMLGHATPMMTLNVYAHVIPDTLDQASDVI